MARTLRVRRERPLHHHLVVADIRTCEFGLLGEYIKRMPYLALFALKIQLFNQEYRVVYLALYCTE